MYTGTHWGGSQIQLRPQDIVHIAGAQHRTLLFNVLTSLEITGTLLTPTMSAAANASNNPLLIELYTVVLHSTPLSTLAAHYKPGQNEQVVTMPLPKRYNKDMIFTPLGLWPLKSHSLEF